MASMKSSSLKIKIWVSLWNPFGSHPIQRNIYFTFIMATGAASKELFFFFFVFLLFTLNAFSSEATPLKDFKKRELQWEKEQIFRHSHRGLLNNFRYETTEFDSIDPPTTTFPITNPVTTPAINTPPVVTIPATYPVTVSPNPTTNPVTIPASTPVTIPASTPVTVPTTNPVNAPIPVVNPVTTPSTLPGGTSVTNPPQYGSVPVTNPTMMPPPTTGNPPAVTGQSWCIAKNGVAQTALQAALDYACGIGGADCATIQQGANCYNPNTLQNHASYAFNSYFQKNPAPTSCDFGGAAAITTTNPSTGSCIYPSSASSSSSPATVNPTPIATPTPTPTTSSSSGSSPGTAAPGSITPPSVLNSSSGFPDSGTIGSFGASPPIMNTSTSSVSAVLQPFIGYLVLVTSITMGRFIQDM